MIRYRQIGYVELNVSDLARSGAFYRQVVGLQPLANGGAAAYCCADKTCSLTLQQQPAPGSGCLGLMLEDDAQFESLHRRLWNAGYAYRELSYDECGLRRLTRATRMVEPFSGITLQFYLPMGGVAAHGFVPSDTPVSHIGQLVLATPRVDDCLAFYRDVLTLQPQGGGGGPVRYLQPYPNRLHQRIGVVFAERPSIRQLALVAAGPDALARAVARCRAYDFPMLPVAGLPPDADCGCVSFADPDGLTITVSQLAQSFGSCEPDIASGRGMLAPAGVPGATARAPTGSTVSG